jgi:cytochrome P450
MGFVGVFSAEGATWITQRRPVTGALSAAHLPGWLPSLTVIMRRVMTPFSHGHWVRRPADRRLDRAVAAMQDHARACIRAARAALDPDTPPRHAADVHRQHPAPRLSCRAAGQRRAGRGAGPVGGECR